MGRTKIEWSGWTWNPVRGCTRISEGCRHCYAEAQAARFSDPGQAFHGFARRDRPGSKWTGLVELIPERLTDPLGWRAPRLIFVNSMSDLFHERLSDDAIGAVFAVMAAAPQHTFQVLTKRADRMREWVSRDRRDICDAALLERHPQLRDALAGSPAPVAVPWPLPNVWLGVSAEDQDAADQRVPELLATPAALRFVSAEPLLGPIRFRALRRAGDPVRVTLDALTGRFGVMLERELRLGQDPRDLLAALPARLPARLPGLDWIITGGESGQDARAMHPAWARAIRDDCAAAMIPFHFKQWGAWAPCVSGTLIGADGRPAQGADLDALLAEPRNLWMRRLPKRQAGAALDGREHRDIPPWRRDAPAQPSEASA